MRGMVPCLLLLGGCAAPGNVQRLTDGRIHSERFIGPASYGAYARGAVLEASGNFEQAERAYLKALEHDPESPELWVRIGSVRCARGADDGAAAFAQAESMTASSAALWQARAECALSQNDAPRAVRAAREALRLDPGRPENTLLLCEALVAAGNVAEAKRYLDALALASPGLERTQRWRARLFDTANAGQAGLRALDQALLQSDFAEAQTRAKKNGLSYAHLTARALALGCRKWGRRRAALAHQADPDSGDAWALALVAADLVRDEEAFAAQLTPREAPTRATDPLVQWLFAELLLRRAGTLAATSWVQSAPPSDHAHDPLLERVKARVTGALNEKAPKASPPPK